MPAPLVDGGNGFATIYGAPYCGAPPHPGTLIARFNLDPVLIAALFALFALHVWTNRRAGLPIGAAVGGWLLAAVAFCSPLCALSVSLFAARVGQHMILVLLAAPLIALALPARSPSRALWPATGAFFAALWFWHMPVPYDATFLSTPIYWAMHLSLFGSAIWLWHGLLRHRPDRAVSVLAAGTVTSVQMGLLGAILTLSGRALFAPHYFTTEAWGLTPLADQQLGGALMWVPGCLFFLWAAMRSCSLLWRSLEPTTQTA